MAKIVFEFSKKCNSSFDYLIEFPAIMYEYEVTCRSCYAIKQEELSSDEIRKVIRIVNLISTLNDSSEWLVNSA